MMDMLLTNEKLADRLADFGGGEREEGVCGGTRSAAAGRDMRVRW